MSLHGRDSWLNQTINILLNTLFKKEIDRISVLKVQISIKNAQMVPGASTGFFFRGKGYSNTLYRMRGMKLGNLHKELIPEMELIIKEDQLLEREKQRVKAGLVLVLNNASNLQDVRDAIPNSLAVLVQNLAELPRIREEAYPIQHDRNKMQQYKTTKDLIDYYAATRFL